VNKPYQKLLAVAILFALAGVIFSGVSTYDFIAHLDRQVHSITCSFIPGMGAPDTAGTSGCYAVLMSPYSSLWRTSFWGGIPIALASLAVFVYLAAKGIDILVRREEEIHEETFYWFLATLLPVLTSAIYFYISVAEIGATCKLCVGIYIASFGASALALLAHLSAPRGGSSSLAELPWGRYAIYFVEGVAFVAVAIGLFLAVKPEITEAMMECGTLPHPEDRYGVRLKGEAGSGGLPTIEILDPLCPACKGFSERLAASGLADKLALETVLFPLDKACNWMVNESLHPGACTVSEAALCAKEKHRDVIDWAFANQTKLREEALKNPAMVEALVKQQFPALADCIGAQETKARLNKSLRWIVANALPVVTPQLYVNGRKLCDEDSDLGMEYALKRLIETAGRSPAAPAAPVIPAAPAAPAPVAPAPVAPDPAAPAPAQGDNP